tara:strand:- start:14896 stop:15594 length:699 start_codon:yes stop_codon:yes gene_type:complete
MIFLNCANEDLVQVNDKTRIDVSRSFVSGDDVTDILIKPEASESYISIFNTDQKKWFLDWSYATDGEKSISVQATDGVNTITQTFTINIISVEEDNLYSNDSQVFKIESELKNYFPQGRNSYINMHREAQSRILSVLDRKRIWDNDGNPYDKNQLNVTGELSLWSLYETILMIYTDLFISVGDKFAEKVNEYKSLRNIERDRGAIRVDKNNSGTIENESETQDLKSFRLIKR